MFHSAERAKRILAEQKIMRSGEAADLSLCRYKSISCVRCCLPHIGGDSHLEDSKERDNALLERSDLAYGLNYSGRYLGPGNIVMKFRNFNPLKEPKLEASRYEDSFSDVGREEMERRFSERRNLFLEIYERAQPGQSLTRYMKAAQRNEGYIYKPAASSGPASLFLGGWVPSMRLRKGGLPECQLLGFVDGKRTAGCMAHPLAETSEGYDGRDQAGFFNYTDGCRSIGCEAGKEFKFLSKSAMKIFDKAIYGMSWYEYSRHATAVLVYYLRSFDHILQRLDERGLLDCMAVEQLIGFTNALYDEWPLKALRVPEFAISGIEPGTSPLEWSTATENDCSCVSEYMNSLDVLSTDIPLSERMMYIALDTWFLHDHFGVQLQQARNHIELKISSIWY